MQSMTIDDLEFLQRQYRHQKNRSQTSMLNKRHTLVLLLAASSAIQSGNFIGADCMCAEFPNDFAGGGHGWFRASVLKT